MAIIQTDFGPIETKPAPAQRCIVKLGEPGRMHECGATAVYLMAGTRGNAFTGWHHEDTTITDHGAVPKNWI